MKNLSDLREVIEDALELFLKTEALYIIDIDYTGTRPFDGATIRLGKGGEPIYFVKIYWQFDPQDCDFYIVDVDFNDDTEYVNYKALCPKENLDKGNLIGFLHVGFGIFLEKVKNKGAELKDETTS